MPKPNKTILDRLNKILKTRQDALNRFDRRWAEWPDPKLGSKGVSEASRLVDDLDDAAGIEYDRVVRSKPGKRIEREAIRMMPDHLIRDNGWY